MTPRRFVVLDVFTDTRFTGNPLAVVLDADGLDTDAMQSIAREFNLSETVFVQPPSQAMCRARLRIFTTARELPFAGHPTVGTATLLWKLDGARGPSEFVLEETIGNVPCRVRASSGDAGHAEFDVPRLPEREAVTFEQDAVAAALGLRVDEIGFDSWPVERWSAGNPFTCVPLASLEASQRCRIDPAKFEQVFGADGKAAAFVFCREAIGRDVQFHARMFATGLGPVEDPATGSAVAAFAGYLAAHERFDTDAPLIRIEQGVEMKRPSSIELRMTLEGGQLSAASIGGSAIVVSEGTLYG